MQEAVHRLDTGLRDFIAQPDDAVLVLRSADADFAMPAKLLEVQARQAASHVYVLATHPFVSAAEYVDVFVRLLASQIDGANQIRKNVSLRPWPELPTLCMNPRLAPAERLWMAARHCRSLLPVGHRIAWVLVPVTIDDSDAYVELVGASVLYEPRWQREDEDLFRFVICDDRPGSRLSAMLELEHCKAARVLEFDFSPRAQADALVRRAFGGTGLENGKLEALFELAALDVGDRRYEDAIAKLEAVSAKEADPARRAACLGALAEIALLHERHALALRLYRSGIALAGPAKDLAGLGSLLLGAGKACMAIDLDEAARYFALTERVAAGRLDIFAKADALELQGLAEARNGRPGEALMTWRRGQLACESFGYDERRRSGIEPSTDR